MIPMFRELYDHMAWADAALLHAARQHPASMEDEELRRVLHHTVLVQQAYLHMLWDCPFELDQAMQPPASFDELETRFRDAHSEQIARLAKVQPSDLGRMVDVPRFSLRFSVAQGLMQVVMHSQAHRAQCATRLRTLGGKPPILDYIAWVKDQ